MAMNRIQFQPGLSMPEFLQRYGTEAQCETALEKARWPDGFRCPRCGGTAYCVVRGDGRRLFQCNACHRQTSLIAGTVFEGTTLYDKLAKSFPSFVHLACAFVWLA